MPFNEEITDALIDTFINTIRTEKGKNDFFTNLHLYLSKEDIQNNYKTINMILDDLTTFDIIARLLQKGRISI